MLTQVRAPDAKQTETSEFGAEKGLLQGHARRPVAHALKSPNSPKGFRKALLFLLKKFFLLEYNCFTMLC